MGVGCLGEDEFVAVWLKENLYVELLWLWW